MSMLRVPLRVLSAAVSCMACACHAVHAAHCQAPHGMFPAAARLIGASLCLTRAQGLHQRFRFGLQGAVSLGSCSIVAIGSFL